MQKSCGPAGHIWSWIPRDLSGYTGGAGKRECKRRWHDDAVIWNGNAGAVRRFSGAFGREFCDGKTGQRETLGQAGDASVGRSRRDAGAASQKESPAAVRERLSASVERLALA